MLIYSLIRYKPEERRGKRRANSAGFTLVEILVASLIGVIILGSAFLIFNKGVEGLQTGSEKMTHLYEANRLMAALREDLKYFAEDFSSQSGQKPVYSFKKWAITARGVTGGAVKKINTLVSYTTEDVDGGIRLIRTETYEGGEAVGTPKMNYGRGLIKNFKLETVDAPYATFFRAVVEMVPPSLTARKDGKPAGTDSKVSSRSLKLSILVLPRKLENITSLQDHWIDNPN